MKSNYVVRATELLLTADSPDEILDILKTE